jgi:hypothetical protein
MTKKRREKDKRKTPRFRIFKSAARRSLACVRINVQDRPGHSDVKLPPAGTSAMYHAGCIIIFSRRPDQLFRRIELSGLHAVYYEQYSLRDQEDYYHHAHRKERCSRHEQKNRSDDYVEYSAECEAA